jgi:hypothetical protein
MTPYEAIRTQSKRYRQMTGEERLSVALRLHELACAVAREGIRQQLKCSETLQDLLAGRIGPKST